MVVVKEHFKRPAWKSSFSFYFKNSEFLQNAHFKKLTILKILK